MQTSLIFCAPSPVTGQCSLSWPKRLADFFKYQTLNLTSKRIQVVSSFRERQVRNSMYSSLTWVLPKLVFSAKNDKDSAYYSKQNTFPTSYLNVSLELYLENMPEISVQRIYNSILQHSVLGNAKKTQWEQNSNKTLQTQMLIIWEFEMCLLVLV